ncbi:MAG: hypothetical protein P1P82_15660 [Bacteroidales bacterium]|nr:hypothetical protein [Bacteroidales bacterium]MDT8430747.1 hypothetical protein [Bacteroidales bacterium]
MKRHTLFQVLLLFLTLFPVAGLFAQKIGNVHPEIRDDQIYIHYDLLGISEDQSVLVTVYMSTDGGKTYGEPLKSVTGDAGLVKGPGREMTISWDVFSDLDELVSMDVKFKVRADLLNAAQQGLSPDRTKKLSLNANTGYMNQVGYASFGLNAKGSIYLNQLGLGLRADYYRAFRQAINYQEASVVYPDTGFYWGYSGGVVVEYDLLQSKRSSLYPYIFIGQSKFIYEYNADYSDATYFEYSVFGSLGIGFDTKVWSFLYLGTEVEYLMSPWIDLVPSASPDEAMDGISVGIVLKFLIGT